MEVRRGTCPVCKLLGLPVVKGVMQDHTTPAGTPFGICTGSGQPPKGDEG